MILTSRSLNNHLSEYKFLRNEIDNSCSVLEKMHKDNLACSPGCTSCCMNFNVFPVEYFSIKEEISKMKVIINKNPSEGGCIFLVDNLCSIYRSRPIICRTHGLPLLSMGEEGWELSHCELNFVHNQPGFNEANTFPADRYNSKLFLLNREFIKSFKGKSYSEFDLVPLSDLKGELYS